jgi:hypothetical protein
MSKAETDRRALATWIVSLRNRLRLHYEDRHVEAAMARLDLESKPFSEVSGSFVIYFRECLGYIKDVLIPAERGSNPASQTPLPTTTYKDKVVSSALPVKEELKTMGFSDDEIVNAISKGHSDTQSCVEYLLSLAAAPATSPAAAASGITVASNGRELVSAHAPTFRTLFDTNFPQEYKGWLYKTAHDRLVDQRHLAKDGQELVAVSAGWDLCHFNQDVALICRIFPWGSQALVLSDGSMCLTAGQSAIGTPGKPPLYMSVNSNCF